MKEPYIPKLNFVYPQKFDEHMIENKIVRDVKIDKDYPFLDKSFKFNFKRLAMHIGIHTLMRLLIFVRLGLKIEGRKYLRKYKKLYKNGAMTVSNHIHKWDHICVLFAIRYRMIYYPAFKENLNSSDGGRIRLAGGIPIPEELSLMRYFNKAFDEIHAKKKWIHASPESSIFWYYQPIRPFKKGVFSLAQRYMLPVIPMAFCYRKPHFPYALVNTVRTMAGLQKLPMVTLRIGEPLFFDETLGRKEAVIKMRKECHEAIVRLAGITNNPYPAEGD